MLVCCALGAVGCSSSSTESVAGPTTAHCSLTVSGTPPVVESSGAAGNLTLAINRECAWTAKPEVAWISLGPASGQGDAQIAYSIASNPQPVERRGAIVVNDHRVELTQRPACMFALTPARAEPSSARQRLTVTVGGPAGCAWKAVSQVRWIEIDSGASGSGPGVVTLEVAGNAGAASRTGAVVIAGVTFTVTQGRARTPAPPAPPPAPTPPTTPVPEPEPEPPAPEPTPPPGPAPPPPGPAPTPVPGPGTPAPGPTPPPPGPDPTPTPGPGSPPDGPTPPPPGPDPTPIPGPGTPTGSFAPPPEHSLQLAAATRAGVSSICPRRA
jgi:hypothetical protein